MNWYQLGFCPRCFREWQCWNRRDRPMSRPHWERVRRARDPFGWDVLGIRS